VIFFEIPATAAAVRSTDTVLLYGHLDKQPEFNGWRNDLGPWTPKYENGLLYGRGGADDGYAVYAAITAIEALDAQGIPRPRCVGLIETCEESGSPTCRLLDALRRGWATSAWWCAWTAAPATTTSSGSPPACAAWSAAC
jgi:acetylornithine deacetylase/succinyl-diaminopimelate desuccinylase-like protein